MQRWLILTLAGWLVVLTALGLSLTIFSNPILPAPGLLLQKLTDLARGPLWPDLALTLLRSVTAFVIALCLGIGWAAVFPPRSARSQLVAPALLLLQAAPVILWIVPLVLLLGTGNTAPIAASVLVVLPLIAFEFRAAFELTSRDRREFWRHYVPYYPQRVALRLCYEWRPHLATATGMGLLMSFKSSAIAEWFAAKNGIGRQLQQSFVLVDTASFLSYALAFLIAALAVTTFAQAAIQRADFLSVLFSEHRAHKRGASQSDLLRLENIGLRFGRRTILTGVQLELRPGEIVLLTGASGSGKSTLARVAAGLIKPTAGRVVGSADSACLVFQSDFLFPRETVFDNAAFHLGRAEKNAAERALRLVGLESHLVAGNLSGGMRRRLALSRALATSAKFLLLDEPFSGLDAEAVRQLLQVIRAEAEAGRGILLITHHLTQKMREAAQKIFVLHEGKLCPA
jgi:NitT/TauT family transport system ATP-binding protein